MAIDILDILTPSLFSEEIVTPSPVNGVIDILDILTPLLFSTDEPTATPGRFVRWMGFLNLTVAWNTRTKEKNMKQYRYPIRMETPQLLKFTFRDLDGTAIDLTAYASVSVIIKKTGVAYTEETDMLDAEFDVAASGKVKYAGYQFASDGSWSVQFVALDVSDKPLYGEILLVTVAKNVPDLGTDELPVL